MHKSNNEVISKCINVIIVNKYLIQKKTCTNMSKFIQILKERMKLKINKKKKIEQMFDLIKFERDIIIL